MTSQEIDTLTLEADIEAAISDELEAKNTGSADVLDRAGDAILELVTRAAGTVQADLQEAREAANTIAFQSANPLSEGGTRAGGFTASAKRSVIWSNLPSSAPDRQLAAIK
jgi:hypothetical protein